MSANTNLQCYSDINWDKLHQNARKQKGWKSKSATDWDKKAPSFSASNKISEYSQKIINNLPLKREYSLLDIGAGPGTLSIPIAKQIKTVTAVDYSQGMLDRLSVEAASLGANNINKVCCSWEDDWLKFDIKPHDIALASRSLNITDLRCGLLKLNRFAKKYVFLTDRINPTPFDQNAFKAIGRSFQAGPDYIFTVNILYSMNIHPNITVLEFDKIKKFADRETAFQSYKWMFHDITTEEEFLLRDYVDSCIIEDNENGVIIKPPLPVRWALIWWRKTK